MLDLSTTVEAVFRAEDLVAAFGDRDEDRTAALIADAVGAGEVSICALTVIAHQALKELATTLDVPVATVRQAVRARLLASKGFPDG